MASCWRPVSAQQFYISPLGDDQADGLSPSSAAAAGNGPFQTPARAQQAIRDLKTNGQFREPVTIHIGAGVYQLSKPLNFDLRDTGFAGREIVWQVDAGAAVFSGGLALADCRPADGGLWSCPAAGLELPGKKNEAPAFNLFVNQQRMQLARWPDNDWAHIKLALNEKSRYTSHEQMPNFSGDTSAAQVHIYPGNDWYDQYLPVAALDPGQNRIDLAADTAFPLVSGERYYLQNLPSALDAPGEWYYDRPNERILFIPPPQVQPENIVASALPNLLTMQGTHHVAFKNLAFRHVTGPAITLKDANHVSFAAVEIDNVDATALEAQNSTEISLVNSHIHDTGQSGVFLNGGNRETLQPSKNLVENNHFERMGLIMYSFSTAIGAGGVGARVAHNLVEHLPGAGLSITGNDHLFENNEISHICEQSSDCGGIYSGRNWSVRGNIIRSNSFHDIYGYGLKGFDQATNSFVYGRGGANAVYLDDGASGFQVAGNLFNSVWQAVKVGGGRDNHIENNLFYAAYDCSICIDNRWPDYDWNMNRKTLAEIPPASPVWQAKYPELAQPMQHDTWPEGNVVRRNVVVADVADAFPVQYKIPAQSTQMGDNLVWNLNGKVRILYEFIDRPDTKGAAYWPEWLALGLEKNSISADPCVTITGNQVKFCPGSPVSQIGFPSLSASMGLQNK
ncbi:MAG: right-handed parallel beta-helix repeat-containing protein [Methylomonas sp.]|jgi:hypothetical protein